MDEKDEDGYLILTRRPNETLRIGDDILLHVVSVGRNVRISIEAPADKRILRSELLEQSSGKDLANTGTRAAEPGRESKTTISQQNPRQPVVRYRRKRKLMTLNPGNQQGTGTGSAD